LSENITKKSPDIKLWMALLPIATLIISLMWNLYVFGDDGLSGSIQIIILFASGLAAIIGLLNGTPWLKQEKQIASLIATAAPSIIILLLVGALASSWLLSGTVPTLIYYGLKLLNPTIFLVACCVSCALTSVATGSSWSTSATLGIAMVGIGKAMGIPEGMIAGAVISGAYFGDKISPLSDTTNLAAAVSEVPLFDHIRYMFLTSGPSIVLTLIIFAVLGFSIDTTNSEMGTDSVLTHIEAQFNVSAWTLVPALITVMLILRRVAAIPALFVGIISGLIVAAIMQQPLLSQLAAGYEQHAYYSILMKTVYQGVELTSEHPMLSELFSTSGMQGMLNTVWLILCAMVLGGVLQACGMISCIMNAIKSVASSLFGLISATTGTCLFVNVSASEQYLAVTIPGRMYADAYDEQGIDRRNLSRTLEDTGTVTSVLVPWNTCGAYHATVLGIGTLTYLPYCFFNIISPIMTLLYAWFKIKIVQPKEV